MKRKMNFRIRDKSISPRRRLTRGLPILSLLISFLSLLPFTSNLVADQEAEHILQMVDGQYGKIKTIGGMISRNIQGGSNTQSLKGDFLTKKSHKSYVEFAYSYQVVVSNDSVCWVHKAEKEKPFASYSSLV